MNPSARFAASLVTSLVLWAPTALACFQDEIDLGSAGLRYLAGFFVAHLATGVLSRLTTAYRPVPPSGPPVPPEPVEQRRREEHSVDAS